MANAFPRTTLTSSPPASDLHVALIYEDFSTGIKAKQVADYVARQMGDGCRVEAGFWNSNLLDDPKLALIAADDAAASAVVVISLHSGRSLTPGIRAWIGQWIGKRQCAHPALVALFDGTKDPSTIEGREYLRRIATGSGFEFLAGDHDVIAAELKLEPGV